MATMAQGAKAGASSQGNHVEFKIKSGENHHEKLKTKPGGKSQENRGKLT